MNTGQLMFPGVRYYPCCVLSSLYMHIKITIHLMSCGQQFHPCTIVINTSFPEHFDCPEEINGVQYKHYTCFPLKTGKHSNTSLWHNSISQ